MKTNIHKACTRGKTDLDWLRSRHSFSFGSYYEPSRCGFGKLRVINDDIVDPALGFAKHPHQNMEIVSIPINGVLRHRDGEGNEGVVSSGEVQVMSAGTGIWHSEYNDCNSRTLNFLQIWITPEKIDINPRYDQKEFFEEDRKNQFQLLVSPMKSTKSGIKINQNAYISITELDRASELSYELYDPSNGVYAFVVEGNGEVAGEEVERRDGVEITSTPSFDIKTVGKMKILVIEVPLGE